MKNVLLFIASTILLGFSSLALADSVDQCTSHYTLCQSSCNRYYEQCISKGNIESYCTGQYNTCENGCQRAHKQCLR